MVGHIFLSTWVWIAGDFVHQEGWSSIQYANQKECIEHMGYAPTKSDPSQDNAQVVLYQCLIIHLDVLVDNITQNLLYY